MRKYVLAAVLLTVLRTTLPTYAAEEPDQAIHEELRAVLATMQNAINASKFDDMLPVVSQDIRATPITQEVISKRDEVPAYFKRWFGPGGFLKSLHMTLTADTLTELSADKTWGMVLGSGLEKYTLADGRIYDMRTRWTAILQKEVDARWRLRGIHIGTDFLDNPILTDAKNKILKVGLAAGGGGLLAGAILGFFVGRRKK
jgi:ketosteroid isomerase-like protein